ncbi:hypothetical protein ACVHNB_32745 [Streptomyces sp. YJ-C3]
MTDRIPLDDLTSDQLDALYQRAEQAEAVIERAHYARRRINSALIAVKPLLTTPYADDPRWTPWTRFVEPALRGLAGALDVPSPTPVPDPFAAEFAATGRALARAGQHLSTIAGDAIRRSLAAGAARCDEAVDMMRHTGHLNDQLRAVIEPILYEYPKHKHASEHEAVLAEIVTAVLGVVLPGARATATLGRMSEADVQRVIDVIEQGPPDEPLDTQWERGWDAAMDAIRAALTPVPAATEATNTVQYWTDQAAAYAKDRDGAYRERAHLVALLAAMTSDAVIAPAPDVDEPGWQIAYLTIGDRQASWHISPRDAELFAAVEHVEADDPRAQWDGHTTDEKYEHIAATTAELMQRCGPECSEGHTETGRCEIARNR